MAVRHRLTIGIRENGVDTPSEAVMILVQAQVVRAWMKGQTVSYDEVVKEVWEYPDDARKCFAKLVDAGVLIRGEAPAGKSDVKYYRPAKGRFYGSFE